MQNTTYWLIDNQVLLQTFVGDQDVDIYRQTTQQAYDLAMASSEKVVHVIADIRKVTYTLPLQDTMQVARSFQSGKAGHTITVGKLDLAARLGATIAKTLLNYQLHDVKTMSAAIDYLKRQEPDLNWHALNVHLVVD